MITENKARESLICPGCGKQKNPGLVVCWHCFKYRIDITPLKYFSGTWKQWLIHVEQG